MLYYAENIKKMRKRKNYTQLELAEGLASQGMISKIEKKQVAPDIDLLESIAEKLDCSLMDLLLKNDENELSQMYSYIENLLSKREYNLLEQFFKSDPSVKIMKQENKSYYKWISGIILTQNYKGYEDGIAEMQEAVKLSTNDPLTIRILVGLSGLYSEVEQFEVSLKYLSEAATLSETTTIELKLKQNINFQLARVYAVLERFDDAVFYSRVAIQFTIEQNSLYLLDDLYLMLAESYLRTSKIDDANTYVKLARTIAEIRSNSQLIPYIERTQSQIAAKL